MIMKFRDVEQSKLVGLLSFAEREENRFVINQPWSDATGERTGVGPSPVIFLVCCKQTARLALGYREMEVTLEVIEEHWVRADRKDGGNPYGFRVEKIPGRIVDGIYRILGRFSKEE